MDESPVEAIQIQAGQFDRGDVQAGFEASEADVVISAGNTGACVAASQLRMRTAAGSQPAGDRGYGSNR